MVLTAVLNIAGKFLDQTPLPYYIVSVENKQFLDHSKQQKFSIQNEKKIAVSKHSHSEVGFLLVISLGPTGVG